MESSEVGRDFALTDAKEALSALAVQLLRLLAGEQKAQGVQDCLESLSIALQRPGASALFRRHEASDALWFTESSGESPDPIEQAMDCVLVGALGMVASRLEGNRVQEVLSLSRLSDGMRELEVASSSTWPARTESMNVRQVAGSEHATTTV